LPENRCEDYSHDGNRNNSINIPGKEFKNDTLSLPHSQILTVPRIPLPRAPELQIGLCKYLKYDGAY